MKLETTSLVTIALGTNLGDRLKNLQQARNELAELSKTPLLQAPIYSTKPVNCPPDSPDFLNTVVAINFDGSPQELLLATQSIQNQLGRKVSDTKNAPRVIDIDILTFGNDEFSDSALIIPHPRLTERRFVLQPLADILPELKLPESDLTIAQHLEKLHTQEASLVLHSTTW